MKIVKCFPDILERANMLKQIPFKLTQKCWLVFLWLNFFGHEKWKQPIFFLLTTFFYPMMIFKKNQCLSPTLDGEVVLTTDEGSHCMMMGCTLFCHCAEGCHWPRWSSILHMTSVPQELLSSWMQQCTCNHMTYIAKVLQEPQRHKGTAVLQEPPQRDIRAQQYLVELEKKLLHSVWTLAHTISRHIWAWPATILTVGAHGGMYTS